jgi:hypothetical protein
MDNKSVFYGLTEDYLKDDWLLGQWYESAIARNLSIIAPDTHSMLNVFGAAAHALKKGTTPVALFVHIVSGMIWKYIPPRSIDDAMLRVANYKRLKCERQFANQV